MQTTTSPCKIEIAYIDPETYASIVNHEMRRSILKALYRVTKEGPVSKQTIAEKLGIGYHQLVYQLNNQLRGFWVVKEERKVRGTRMELISAASPNTVFIALGKNNAIFVVDPIANLFGPLSRVGTRCDSCSEKIAASCSKHVKSKCGCAPILSDAAKSMLQLNDRKPPFRAIDHAIVCAIEGLAKGRECKVEIPCGSCAFERNLKLITIEQQ